MSASSALRSAISAPPTTSPIAVEPGSAQLPDMAGLVSVNMRVSRVFGFGREPQPTAGSPIGGGDMAAGRWRPRRWRWWTAGLRRSGGGGPGGGGGGMRMGRGAEDVAASAAARVQRSPVQRDGVGQLHQHPEPHQSGRLPGRPDLESVRRGDQRQHGIRRRRRSRRTGRGSVEAPPTTGAWNCRCDSRSRRFRRCPFPGFCGRSSRGSSGRSWPRRHPAASVCTKANAVPRLNIPSELPNW